MRLECLISVRVTPAMVGLKTVLDTYRLTSFGKFVDGLIREGEAAG